MITTHLALADLAPALERIAARSDQAIQDLRIHGHGAAWSSAMEAVLAISRAPKHLIRAQLVLLGGVAGGAHTHDATLERFATGVELLHLHLVIQEDVMSNATLRRGKPALRIALQQLDPTLGWQGARDLAVVMGNLVEALAMQHLMPEGGPGEHRACALLIDALARARAGQFRDLMGWRHIGEGEAALRQVLIDKTAYEAFAAPFAAGFVMARADADLGPAIAWGCRLGLAFQVLDHLADLIAPPLVTGKDNLRVILEGRPSLPLFILRERARGEDRELLDGLVGHGTMTAAQRAELQALVERHRVVDACADYVRREIEAATEVSSQPFTERGRAGMAAVAQGLGAHMVDVILEAARPKRF